MTYLGWVGAALFTIASVYQVTAVWRQGHARGIAWWYLLLVWLGFCCMGWFTWSTHASNALIYSYLLQWVSFTLMILRKRFPVKTNNPCAEP